MKTLLIAISFNCFLSLTMYSQSTSGYEDSTFKSIFQEYIDWDKDSIFLLWKDISGLQSDTFVIIRRDNDKNWGKTIYFRNANGITDSIKKVVASPFISSISKAIRRPSCDCKNLTFMTEMPNYYIRVKVQSHPFVFLYSGLMGSSEKKKCNNLKTWDELWHWQ